jgi:hypothetical protein
MTHAPPERGQGVGGPRPPEKSQGVGGLRPPVGGQGVGGGLPVWRQAVRALAYGLGISLAVAALGQAVGLALYLARGASGGYGPYVRLGAVYVELFHHVPVAVAAPAGAGRPLSAQISIALLLVTGGAAVALAAAARRLPVRASGVAAMVALGAIALGYAAVPCLLALASRGRVPLPGGVRIGAGSVVLDVSAAAAFVTALSIAAVSAAFGALSGPTGRGERQAEGDAVTADVVAGGLRSFALALVLAVAGTLVLASVQPALARAYLGVIGSPDSPRGKVVAAGHAVLLLPNQALWALVPATGACDEVAVNGEATPFLCAWRMPTEPTFPTLADGTPRPNPRFRPPPRGYLAFLLVPLAATILGGVRAARGATSRSARIARGAASGVVFAALVAAAIALARVDLTITGGFLGARAVRLTVGPELLRGTALALAWGIAGGAAGGVAARYLEGTGTSSE